MMTDIPMANVEAMLDQFESSAKSCLSWEKRP